VGGTGGEPSYRWPDVPVERGGRRGISSPVYRRGFFDNKPRGANET